MGGELRFRAWRRSGHSGDLCCLAPGTREPVGVLGGSAEVGRSWHRVPGETQQGRGKMEV